MRQGTRHGDRYIVRRGKQYVYSATEDRGVNYTNSPYDAWHTPWIKDAENVAHKVCGVVMVFNPILCRVEEYMA